MNKEYIEREALIEELKRRDFLPVIVKHAIEAVPAADVALVVHGRWVNRYITGEDPYKCSCCGDSVNVYGYHYCPNCGAKMDGGTP